MSAYSLIGYCYPLTFAHLIDERYFLVTASGCTSLTPPQVDFLLCGVYSLILIGLFSVLKFLEFCFWYKFVGDPCRILTLYLEYG